jgi:hypothetical protein
MEDRAATLAKVVRSVLSFHDRFPIDSVVFVVRTVQRMLHFYTPRYKQKNRSVTGVIYLLQSHNYVEGSRILKKACAFIQTTVFLPE